MYSIAFEFETEKEMLQVANQLWKKHGITGEQEMYQSGGRYRLHIYSEKQIKESILEKIPGKKIQSRGSYGTALPKEAVSDND